MFRNNPIGFCICICLIPFVVGLVILFFWWLSKLNTRLIITTKRTTLRRGILSKHTTEVRHSDVRNLQVSQTFMQRLMGVGTLGVSSAAQAGIEIVVPGISDPAYAKDLIDHYRQ